MLLEQTRDYISELTDDKLIEYVLEGIYEPEAIAFAAEEIKRRDLDPERLVQLNAVATSRVEARRAESIAYENRPLSFMEKTTAFIHGVFDLHFWPLLLFRLMGRPSRSKNPPAMLRGKGMP